MHSSSPRFVLHALPISSSLTWSFYLYLENITNYETPNFLYVTAIGKYKASQLNSPVDASFLLACVPHRRAGWPTAVRTVSSVQKCYVSKCYVATS
jgi:hypothetical protein